MVYEDEDDLNVSRGVNRMILRVRRYERWMFGAAILFLFVYSMYLRDRRSPRCEIPIPPCPDFGRDDILRNQSVVAPPGNAVREKKLFDAPTSEQVVVFKKVATDREHLEKLKERQTWASKDWEDLLLDLAEDNSMQGYTIIALANSGMKEMTMNWIASLLRNGFKKFVVICFDFPMYMFLAEYGFERNSVMAPQDWLRKPIQAGFQTFASDGYNELLHGKLTIIIQLWKHGRGIFYNDVDLVFLSPHAFEYIMFEFQHKTPDFIYMVDAVDNRGVDYLNGGFWLGRPTANNIAVFTRALELSLTRKGLVIDQNALNHVLEAERSDLKYSPNYVALSKAMYPAGIYIHKEKWNAKLQVYPMVAHFNYLVGNGPKKQLLKKFNMWYVGETFAS